MQLTFEIVPDKSGGYHARCQQVDIFTQGETLDEVRENVLEAVQGYFFDQPAEYLVSFKITEERIQIPA